ncbi:MAG: hypothetical protein QXT25_03180 [Candidatus Anstonellaceae archaeon]
MADEEYIIGIAILLAAILVSASIYFSSGGIEKSISGIRLPQAAPAQNVSSSAPSKVNLYIISDKRCDECPQAVSQILPQLNSLVPNLNVEQYDYSDSKGKALYESAGGRELLPLFLFDDSVRSSSAYPQLAQYLSKAGNYYSLPLGFFDPKAEICGNGLDDDGNGAADCQDAACKSHFSCMQKTEKPTVELFVMSYCPFGTQMQKGMLPVVDLLGDKVNWNVRFVNYIMHEDIEAYENQLQYCLQIQNKSLYFKYLSCFLNNSKSEECLNAIGVDRTQLQECTNKTDAEFNITANLKDPSKYLSGRYPLFLIHDELNKKYNVRGSPTFVVNGVVVENQARDPQSILKTVCAAFTTPPSECSKTLSNQAYSPGFGFTYQASGAVAGGACG